ncbi:hypothetical protein CORC01_06484 [Colletotrichum orchidophilum]|uniref:Uncharacterized protein n=1 Tax=Colletotrichum orchidophilum TaxID=1209926 RepID=A0A1G4BA45_9PEZI|nr:uncharacterized protein CORC01_06484 [Colletotrichum orchidophilum]OHE98287.1 hypothetical protein CORC01_06484 [Colletotrichum orchidophilum]
MGDDNLRSEVVKSEEPGRRYVLDPSFPNQPPRPSWVGHLKRLGAPKRQGHTLSGSAKRCKKTSNGPTADTPGTATAESPLSNPPRAGSRRFVWIFPSCIPGAAHLRYRNSVASTIRSTVPQMT